MAPAAALTSEPERRPPANWARAAEGIQMAGIALFLLLNTSGMLPWTFWLDAVSLWPLLIMSGGIKIAFEKSRVPWVVLLGPALVLGALAWVASGARADVPIGPWRSETKPRPEAVERLRLTTNLAGSRLDVVSGELDPALLVDARSVGRPGNAGVDVSAEHAVAHLVLKGGWPQGVTLPRKQRWDLRLPASLPVALDLRGAGVRSSVDLSRGRVEDGRIDGVFLATELRLPAPPATVKLVLNGVFNALHVIVPPGVPVRVEGAGLPFNAVQRDARGSADTPGYELKVTGIFSAVSVTRAEAEDAPQATAPQPRPRTPAEAAPGSPPAN